MGVDIGGSSRVGIAIVNDKDKLLMSGNIPFVKKEGVGSHRRKMTKHIRQLVEEFDVGAIVIERVKMHRGKRLSKLSAIVSLARAGVGVFDAVYDLECKVYDIETVSWKAQVLGTRSATKEDAVWFVKNVYKNTVPHDEADAICQAIYLARNYYRSDNIMKEITDK